MNPTHSTERYLLFVLLLLAIILTIIIFSPFLTMFILAAAFSVILKPIYLWIKKHLVKNISWLASIITIIIFVLCLCIPLFFIGKAVFNQTQDLYSNILSKGTPGEFVASINQSVNRFFPVGFKFDLQANITQAISSLSNNIGGLFSATLQSILMFALMLFSLFYLLKDGEDWKEGFVNILPLKNDDTNEILVNLRKSINRIFKGSFIIAIAQGILAWAGFTIFGVPNAVIWAVVAGIASFVPTIGTAIVSVPAVLFLFFTGMQLQALGLLIWSVILVGTIDNVLNPYIISKDTEIPSLFILFAILGTITFIGPLGILIGPLILSLLYSLISIYKKNQLAS
ncbi:MAG TPA: AI-2E family transporter [Candidatus Paceibacterota bacterium]|nr:AI-2E family transporter [Candidatus Paceibacterota bacterium]